MAHFGKSATLLGEVVAGRGNAHQPAQPQSRQLRYGLCQFRQGLGRYAALARLAADVDLQAHVEGWQGFWPLLAQAPGDLNTVNAVNPVKVFGDAFCFITLYRADEVPADPKIRQSSL